MTLISARKILAAILLLATFSAPAAAQSVKTVYFRNECSLPIKFSANFITPFNIDATSRLKTI
ncbi:hypothetical protein [Pseudooceanicola sp. MF1-13]|uniref:hypothetical protein n=1 Tax=Pseudooceanicola sp. MF1-13 TaxID=3379095 RepID=UPI003892301A